MTTCSFCKKTIRQGTGMLYVRLDGSTLNFCEKRCEMSMLKHKRNPKKQKWVTKTKKTAQKTEEKK